MLYLLLLVVLLVCGSGSGCAPSSVVASGADLALDAPTGRRTPASPSVTDCRCCNLAGLRGPGKGAILKIDDKITSVDMEIMYLQEEMWRYMMCNVATHWA